LEELLHSADRIASKFHVIESRIENANQALKQELDHLTEARVRQELSSAQKDYHEKLLRRLTAAERVSDLRHSFILLNRALQKARIKGDQFRFEELLHGRNWLRSWLDLLPALLASGGSLDEKIWKAIKELKAEVDSQVVPALAHQFLTLQGEAPPEETTPDPEVPATPPEDEWEQPEKAEDQACTWNEHEGRGEFTFDQAPAPDQSVVKYEASIGVEWDPEDQGLMIELGVSANPGLVLAAPESKKAKTPAPISPPASIKPKLENQIAQSPTPSSVTPSEEADAPSARGGEDGPTSRDLERADNLVERGLRLEKSTEDARGLKNLGKEVNHGKAINRWVKTAVVRPSQQLKESLVQFKQIAAPPFAPAPHPRPNLPIEEDQDLQAGEENLKALIKDLKDAALGLLPGYDIGNFLSVLATDQTLLGEEVHAGLDQSFLGAAAVLSVVEPFGTKGPMLKKAAGLLRQTKGVVLQTGDRILVETLEVLAKCELTVVRLRSRIDALTSKPGMSRIGRLIEQEGARVESSIQKLGTKEMNPLAAERAQVRLQALEQVSQFDSIRLEASTHHMPGHPDYRGGGDRTTSVPRDAMEAFENAWPAFSKDPNKMGETWWAKSGGDYYRYQGGKQGNGVVVHWNGLAPSSRTKAEDVPNYLKEVLNLE
jgi:hypothetical protein